MITDRKRGRVSSGTNIQWFVADVLATQQYYPFGMLMPGNASATLRRQYSLSGADYRYGPISFSWIQPTCLRSYQPHPFSFLKPTTDSMIKQIFALFMFFVITFCSFDTSNQSDIIIISHKQLTDQEIGRLNMLYKKEIVHRGCYSFDLKNSSNRNIYIPVSDFFMINFNHIEYFETLNNSKISIPESFGISDCITLESHQALTLYGCFFTNNKIDSIEFMAYYYTSQCLSQVDNKILKYGFKVKKNNRFIVI